MKKFHVFVQRTLQLLNKEDLFQEKKKQHEIDFSSSWYAYII